MNAGIQPVPMLGHVTSSYHSAALGRSFALALIKNGRNLIGQTLTAAVGDRPASTSSSATPSSTIPKGSAAMAESTVTAASDRSPAGRSSDRVSPAAHLAERFAAARGDRPPRRSASAKCRS